MIFDLIAYVLIPCALLALAVWKLPMPLRDRYALQKFAVSFLLCFLMWVCLILIVRLFDKELDHMKAAGSAKQAWLLFLYKSPPRIMEVIPGSGILACFFTAGSLIRSNELTAFRALGINLSRLAVPICLFTCAVCVISLIFTDKILAPSTRLAAEIDPMRPTATQAREVVYREKTGALAFIQSLTVTHKMARNLTFFEFKDGKPSRQIYAKQARWDDQNWHMSFGWTREYSGGGVAKFEPFKRQERVLDADPRTLLASSSKPEELTFAELRRVADFKRRIGFSSLAEEVQFHHNIAYSFTLLVGVMLSLPLSLLFGRFAVSIGFPATLLISFIYWGLASATFEAMGENGRLPPMLAAWLANILFAGASVLLFRGVRR